MSSQTGLLVAGALLLVALERIAPLRRLRLPVFRAGFASDIVFFLLGFVATSEVSLRYVAASTAGVRELGLPALAGPLWATSLLALILLDLGNYVAHRWLHRSDVLWEFHKVHHSSRKLDWLATFRSHLVEQILRRAIAPLGLIALGLPAGAVAIAASIALVWAMFNHSNLAVKLHFLEPLFVTPRLHQVHHGTSTSERNFGTVFSIWDRMSGRLETGRQPADLELGVPGEAATYPQSFFPLLREPFRRLGKRLFTRREDVQHPAHAGAAHRRHLDHHPPAEILGRGNGNAHERRQAS